MQKWAKEVSLDLSGLSTVINQVSHTASLTLSAVNWDALILKQGEQSPVERIQEVKAKRNTVAAQRDSKRRQRAARFQRKR